MSTIKTEKQYHINMKENDVGEFCLLTGDPGRCQAIADHFENAQYVTSNREFTTYTGYLAGKKVSVTSTGIGGPSASIAMEELAAIGVKNFIRIGTCGGINLKVHAGDIVVATGAIRNEGTSREYAPIEYPAVPDFYLTSKIVEVCNKRGVSYHAGVVQCKDSFYGQHSPEIMPVSYELLNKWEAWKRLGVLASEMESAALFVVAARLGVRCASLFNVVWNQERKLAGITNEEDCFSTELAIEVAVEAMNNIIGEAGKLDGTKKN